MSALATEGAPGRDAAFIVERLVGEIGEPDRVLGSARGLGERAAPAIAEAFGELFPQPVGVTLATVELSRMADARPRADDGSAICVAASVASPDALVLSVDTKTLGLLVSLAFGGEAESVTASAMRTPSAADLGVATAVMHGAIGVLNGHGPRSLAVRMPAPPAISGEAAAAQVIRDGPAVRIGFSVHAGSASGQLTLTMPQRLMLKPRGEGGAATDSRTETGAGWTSRFGDEVMRSRVRLDATVPLARLTLAELAGLHVGQLIELPATAQAETLLSSKDKTLFVCEFGKLGQNFTVRISKPFDAGEDLMDGLMRG